MNNKIRTIVITGNSKRHLHLVETLEKQLDLVKVISEQKFDYVEAFKYSPDSEAVSMHFNLRDESEQLFFGDSYPDSEIVTLIKGEVNSEENVQELTELSADLVVLFGSSIIKRPLLTHYDQRVVNLHLGLSPYFRGSGTNFWPVVEGKPECIGATIHLAVSKVDAGPILHQVRPEGLTENDSIHDLGNKTIRTAVSILPEVLKAFHTGVISPCKQRIADDKEYIRMDLAKKYIDQAYHNIESGILREYLAHRTTRNQRYPIISQISNNLQHG